jgi:hypothetical protein
MVLAIDVNKISDKAWQAEYPNDTIKYDYTFNSTEVNSAPAKGRIIERIDSDGNRTDYDHRTVTFKRWETASGSSVFDSYKDTTFGSTTSIPTFGLGCKNNYIGDYAKYTVNFLLSNNSIGINSIGNKIGDSCYNNNIGDYFSNNNIGNYFYTNKIGNQFENNKIANNFHLNIINDTFNLNEISDEFNNNTCDANFISNFIGYNFTQNVIGVNFGFSGNYGIRGNLIKDNFSGNIIADSFNDNIIGNSFIGNKATNNFQKNVVRSGITVDFLLATHVYNNYDCTIYTNSLGVDRLYYIDNFDVMIFTASNA